MCDVVHLSLGLRERQDETALDTVTEIELRTVNQSDG